MFKQLILGLVLGLATFATPAFAQEVPTAADRAVQLKSLIGTEYDGGIKFTDVKAEPGNVLVITIDGQQGWFGMTQEQVTGIFMESFCQGPDAAAFVKTGWIRIDTVDHGKDLKKGTKSNTCPAS